MNDMRRYLNILNEADASPAEPTTPKVLTGTEMLTLDDGWRWVELSSTEDLRYEAEHMHSTVDSMADDRKLNMGDTHLYSLRDPNDRPYVTMQITDGKVAHILGRNNTQPKARHKQAIRDMLWKLKSSGILHGGNKPERPARPQRDPSERKGFFFFGDE